MNVEKYFFKTGQKRLEFASVYVILYKTEKAVNFYQ